MGKSRKKRSREKGQATTVSQPSPLIIPEKWIFAGLAASYLLLVLWGFLSEGTWDDDCPTRFYRVRDALNNPYWFISTWVRPLFTILYVLPLQFGRDMVIFETALISTLSCYIMYRSAVKLGIQNAFMVIPLLAFQAFYFPISFNALSEPLGGLLLALGLFLYLDRKYLLFAIVGGLLPLARIELAPLLLFWAIILVREKRFALVFLLGLPVVLWNFTGTLLEGDLVWLYHMIFTGAENRYGHGSFWQYFHRYIFFLGPAIFYLFLIGLQERVFKRKVDFISIQFAVGFLIYVLFSWKLSVGHAAGFMRNVYPLSPFAALIALEGYNLHFMNCTSAKRFKRQLIYIAVTVVLTLAFFSRKLVIHHLVSDQVQYVNIAVMIPIIILFLIGTYFITRIYASKGMQITTAITVMALSMGYTLITEPPIGLIPERQIMGDVAKWYGENNLDKINTYVNHIWFFYSEDLDYNSDHFYRTTIENLDSAPVNSIIIWESHYAYRGPGDVPLDYFQDKPYKLVGQMKTPDSRFYVAIFQKIG